VNLAPTRSITVAAHANKVKLNIVMMESQSEWGGCCAWRTGLLYFSDNEHRKNPKVAHHDAALPVISAVLLFSPQLLRKCFIPILLGTSPTPLTVPHIFNLIHLAVQLIYYF